MTLQAGPTEDNALRRHRRVIATCAAQTVPYAWVAQTRPGGVILAPWGSTLDNSALLRLAVDHAGAAVGSIVDWANFMRLRAQRPVIGDEPDDFDITADRDHTDVDLADLLGEHSRFGIGLRVPDCRLSWDLGEDGYLSTLWLLAPDSWASVHDRTVRQAGPRRLFDEVISAYTWWQHADRPHRDRYGVTVTPMGQSVWLDDPSRPVPLTTNRALAAPRSAEAVTAPPVHPTQLRPRGPRENSQAVR